MRKFGAFLILFLLLPCVITVFVKGGNVLNRQKDLDEYVKTEDGVTLRWEDYLLGSLAANVSEKNEPEMLKAQAVVLRTQAAVKLQNNAKLDTSYFTVEDLKDKYDEKDFRKYMEKYEHAIHDTKREILSYEGQIATTPYHILSSGMTRDAAEVFGKNAEGASLYPYLVGVDCSADKEAKGEMKIQEFTYEEVQKKCQPFIAAVEGARGTDPVENIKLGFSDFKIGKIDSAGYVIDIQILDRSYSGEQFCRAMGLNSSAFSLEDYNGKMRITTIGQGHGLGLSQYTANEMAKAGATYHKILEFFYGGTTIQENNEIFLKLE